MYESFFGFRQRPFLTVPTVDRYFPSTSIERAIQDSTRCIQRGEGPAVIVGGAGLGKTMSCLLLAQHFKDRFDVVLLASSQICTRRALLQYLLYELRLPYRDRSEGDLRLAINQRLLPNSEHSNEGLLLIVDEAQTLSTKLLDELRLLTNIIHQGVPRVRLVLCGTMKLEDLLTHPQLESLNQRIASRNYLTPLSSYETTHYVRYKIERSGVHPDQVITGDALDALFRGSDGIPRLIDQLADHAFYLAEKMGARLVNATIVGQAWSALQQLPNPWSEPTIPASNNIQVSLAAVPSEISNRNRSALDSELANHRSDDTSLLNTPDESQRGIEFGSLDEWENREEDSLIPSGASNHSLNHDQAGHSPQPSASIPIVANEASDKRNRPTGSLFHSFLEPLAFSPAESSLDAKTASEESAVDNSATWSDPSFEAMMPKADLHSSTEMAGSFIDLVHSANLDEGLTSAIGIHAEPYQITQDSTKNDAKNDLAEIERQLEAELREMVSNINLDAIASSGNHSLLGAFHSVSESNRWAMDSEFACDRSQIQIPAQDVLSLDVIDRDEFSTESILKDQSKMGYSDDRDMIVVVEDEEEGEDDAPSASPARPVGSAPKKSTFANWLTTPFSS
jgi:type II secretory pathway predicted ATPase ExeA